MAESQNDAPQIETAEYVYAKHGPIQSIPLKIREGDSEPVTLMRDFRPGKPVALPPEHKVTKSLESLQLIVPVATDRRETGDKPPDLTAIDVNDTRRVAAIVDVLPLLADAEKTQAGKPRIDALEERLGFRPTSGEVDTAIALTEEN